MGPIGAQEMIFIFVLALLLFGPKKLPELGRLLGKGLTEFRRAKNELKTTFESHMQELEREANLADKPAKSKWDQSSNTSYSSASYPYTYDEYGRQSASGDAVAEPSETASPSSSPEAASYPPPSRSEPVTGTVPRSGSATVIEPVSATTEENRRA